MAKRITVAMLAEQVATLSALVIAQGAPVAASAKAPVGPTKFADTEFGASVIARQAEKIACELGHGAACNRTFSPKSSGRQVHVARIV